MGMADKAAHCLLRLPDLGPLEGTNNKINTKPTASETTILQSQNHGPASGKIRFNPINAEPRVGVGRPDFRESFQF
jgi:hypothetical protein